MPDVKSDALRIYCLCGQKMKVSEKMYGLPGKCIACRQKIRIPRKDEVPEGTTEIHLRDHPELLRGKPKATPVSDEERAAQRALKDAGGPKTSSDEESTPNTELDLLESPPVGDSTKTPREASKKRRGASIPLDTLLPLQVLCSLQYKLSRQLDTLQLNSHDDEVLLAQLEGYVSRVRKARRRLDDHMHQVLMETAIELANTQEKLAQIRLSTRVGEMSWVEFRETAHRLRARRDRLERRQQNLRGWLAAKDPYLAGGLLDLAVESIPSEDAPISIPSEPDDEGSPLSYLTEGLRSALEERAAVRQRQGEVQRMGESKEAEELKKEVGQQRILARARVSFYHDRLQQLKKDYASDMETATAALGIARDQLRVDDMDRGGYDALDREVLRSKKDIARAQSVIARALGANAASDVPSPRGTFLERLGVAPSSRTGPDAIAGYAAVVLFVASIFTPSVGSNSLVSAAMELAGTAGAIAWLFLLPVALAAVAAVASPLRSQVGRGLALLAVGAIGSIAACYFIHEGSYGFNSFASRFRVGPPWYVQPGVLLGLLGAGASLAGGTFALWSSPRERVWPVASFAVIALAIVAITTDLLGTRTPGPTVRVELSASEAGAGVIRVENIGGRAIYLLDRPSNSKDGYQFLMERRVGPTSFAAASGQGPAFFRRPIGTDPAWATVDPGGAHEVPFVVEPGEYRVTLEPAAPGQPIEEQFTVEGPPILEEASQASSGESVVVPPAPVIEPAPAAPEDSENMESTDLAAEDDQNEPAPAPDTGSTAGAQVDLSGIIGSGDDAPRFSIEFTYADGFQERITLGLGDAVWDDWVISEFNPDERTITLQKEGRILILRRGTPLTL